MTPKWLNTTFKSISIDSKPVQRFHRLSNMPVRVVEWERKKAKCKKDTTKQDIRIAKSHRHQPAIEGAAVTKRYGIAAATNKNNCRAGHVGQQLPKPDSS